MAAPDTIDVTWNEDGSATILGRVTSRSGSGAATGVDGEGNWVQQSDLSSIPCAVFDVSNANTSIATPSVTISSVILDTPVTTNVIWTIDSTGYNFIVDLAAASFPIGGHIYAVEYYFTATGGENWPSRYQGEAKARIAG